MKLSQTHTLPVAISKNGWGAAQAESLCVLATPPLAVCRGGSAALVNGRGRVDRLAVVDLHPSSLPSCSIFWKPAF